MESPADDGDCRMIRSGDWRRARSENELARQAVELVVEAVLWPFVTAAALIVLVRPEDGLLGKPERLVVFAVFAANLLRALSVTLQLFRVRRGLLRSLGPDAGSSGRQPMSGK
jgi:hypothetical protein